MSATTDENASAFVDIEDDMLKLKDFGVIFSHAVGSLGNSVSKLQYSYRTSHDLVHSVREICEESKWDIGKLKDENNHLKVQLNIVNDAVTHIEDRIRTIKLNEPLANDNTEDRNSSSDSSSSRDKNVPVDGTVVQNGHNTHYSTKLTAVSSNESIEKRRSTNRASIIKLNNSHSQNSNVISSSMKGFTSNLVACDHEPIPINSTDGNSQQQLSNALRIIEKRLLQLERSQLLQKEVNVSLKESIENDKAKQIIIETMNDQFCLLEDVITDLTNENIQLNGKLQSMEQQLLNNSKQIELLMAENKGKRGSRRYRGKDINASDMIDDVPLDSYTIEESDVLTNRVNDIESSVLTEIRLANQAVSRFKIDIDDIVGDFSSFKVNVTNMVRSVKTEIEAAKSSPGSGSGKNIQTLLKPLKLLWVKLQDKITYGLNTLQDEDQYTVLGSNIIKLVQVFNDDLDELIISFNQQHTFEDTLKVLWPVLNSVTIQLEDILEMDAANHKTNTNDEVSLCTLNDIPLNMNDHETVKHALMSVFHESLPVLDEYVDKITMRRHINKLREQIVHKSESSYVEQMEHSLRSMINSKADQEFLELAVSKKASMKELFAMKEQLFKSMDLLRPAIVGVAAPVPVITPIPIEASADMLVKQQQTLESHSGRKKSRPKTPEPSPSDDTPSIITNVIKAERDFDIASNKKFGMILDQFKDLQKYCESFVSRDEIETALKMVLQEVREVKLTSISTSMLKEGLRCKADDRDVKKLIEAVTFAVGSLEGTNKAAAVHKCLVCDKPVTSVNPRNNMPLDNEVTGVYARLGSPDVRDRVRVAQDLTILRNSIDLPPLNSNNMDDMVNSGSINTRPNTVATANYKQRIKSSVGGGYK